jgi:L-asparaginase/Glu-tRNA(Gln) amidotransferase subunit D
MEAFSSPNFPPLATIGVNFDIRWDLVMRHTFEGKMEVFSSLSENVAKISVAPCMNLKVLEAVLNNSEAIIIEAYGMGNIPSNNKKLLQVLKTAADNGKILVIIS